MIEVYCVKVKPEFTAEYVNKLYHAVERNLTIQHDFYCITDDPTDLECDWIRVTDFYPRWWAKMYTWREAGDCLNIYFDLDTVIVGNIDFLASYKGDFAILQNWRHPYEYASGLYLYNGHSYRIWDHFTQNEQRYMKEFRGDQEYLSRHHPGADYLQRLFPNKFASYKDWVNEHGIKDEAVVMFHGEPRPADIADKHDWMKEHWR